MNRNETPSSSFTGEWEYDVFISFRGKDTRTNFTGNLYNSLNQKGIRTFFDESELRKGDEITPTLLKAIQQSRIAIVVFSENYASSTFCLEELVNILRHLKGQGRLVWPIFYGVDPSEVRHQNGNYGKALTKLEGRFQDNIDKVTNWREALTEAANLSGFHFQQHGSQSEYKFISGIIEKVSKMISRVPLHIAEHPVGLESSVTEVTLLLELGSDEGVIMVGICGIGGIGKTTIARAVYNSIGDQFESVCFLADIREKAVNKHGLVELQETLLSELVSENNTKLGDVNRGIPMIKRRLRRKKILMILDDVDKLKQLQAIAGGHDWFGCGSRIIITTRNKHLLITHGVVKLYEVKELNVIKSLELFSWNAFKSDKVDPCYMDISKRVVFYSGGLPLALEVIGSNLFGKTLEEWISLLDKYERIPNKEVHEILKISYDSLEEDEKEIFLDIACFFNNYKMRYVKEMLYARGFHAEIGIRVLIDKSLIKIDGFNCLKMHDLTRDMGREIVRQESKSEPGERSRLWSEDDIIHVLEENRGTDKTEVIMLSSCKDKVHWSGDAFKAMKKLKILIIGTACFSSGPRHLPNSLKVMDWSGYPSQSLPSNFDPKNLVILSLPESRLRIFKPLKMFHSLYFMDFEGCKFLKQVPDLSGLPNLGALCLDNCRNLVRVHDSVGFLEKLRLLSAQGCTQLYKLVYWIKLISLETLDLRGCSSLEIFPKVLETMEYIRDVYLDETSIKEFPLSFENLVGLERLYLRNCTRLKQLPSSIVILPKLEVILVDESGGLQFYGGYKIIEKIISEVSQGVLYLYSLPEGTQKLYPNTGDLGFCDYLNVFCINISPYNFIQVCSPLGFLESIPYYAIELQRQPSKYRSWHYSHKSSVSFWFHERFPRIALCVIGVSSTGIDKFVLDVKLSVLVNDAEQLNCSSNYIVCMKDTDIVQPRFLCDLQSKLQRVDSEHEWDHVEISCEMKYRSPYGEVFGGRVTEGGAIYWAGIHVYQTEDSSLENIRFTNPNVSHSQAQAMVDTNENAILMKTSQTPSYQQTTMKKMILKVELHNDRIKQQAIMNIVSRISVVESISVDRKDNKLTIIGEIDAVCDVEKLGKLCNAEIVSVGPAEVEKKEESTPRPYLYYYTTIVQENPNSCVIR